MRVCVIKTLNLPQAIYQSQQEAIWGSCKFLGDKS